MNNKNAAERLKFSVITPCYKTAPETLARAIESALAQGYGNLEIIVVDDDEAGTYREAIEEYAREVEVRSPKVHFFFHKRNMGANVARNTAIAASTGDWLAFLDSDDSWDPDYLDNVAAKVSSGNFALVSTPIRIESGRGVREMPFSHFDGDIFDEEINGDIISPSSGVCVRKDALLEAGGFDDALPARQDYDMWLRICERYEVAFCDKVAVTVYRDGHESISSGYKRHLAGTLAVIEKISANSAIGATEKAQALDSQYRYLASFLAKKGQGALAREYLGKVRGDKGFALTLACRFPRLFKMARGVFRAVAYQG